MDEPHWAGSDLKEPDRFRDFYAVALPRVHSYLYRRCNADLGLTEDLTQDVFIAIVASIRQGTVGSDPVQWAIGIARHKLLDHFRRQRRAGWTLVPYEDMPSDTFTAEELSSLEADIRERAMSALALVPSPQREALMLRYFDGLTAAEIADALGRSVSSVESLLVRGRVAFRRHFLGDSYGS